VHGVAAEDQGRNKNDPAVEREPQQRSERPNRTIGYQGSSGMLGRQLENSHEASGKRRRGEKSGIEPNSRGNPELRDGPTGEQDSANERRGASTMQRAIVEALLGRILG
jgi:hypothetical protein